LLITLLLGSAAQAGLCDNLTLSTIAGHSSVRVTERYIHPQAKLISEALEKIANPKKVVIATISEAGSNLRDSLQTTV
jgi:hypothetical protein